MGYEFDNYGWYAGQGEGNRSTSIAPDNLSVSDVVGDQRANFTGYAWVDFPYVAPVIDVPPPEAPPVLIATKYKFRLALLRIGLLDDIESFMAVTEDKAVKIAWQYADEYRTDDPLVLGMGYALGKTDAEIRDVFELANSL